MSEDPYPSGRSKHVYLTSQQRNEWQRAEGSLLLHSR